MNQLGKVKPITVVIVLLVVAIIVSIVMNLSRDDSTETTTATTTSETTTTTTEESVAVTTPPEVTALLEGLKCVASTEDATRGGCDLDDNDNDDFTYGYGADQAKIAAAKAEARASCTGDNEFLVKFLKDKQVFANDEFLIHVKLDAQTPGDYTHAQLKTELAKYDYALQEMAYCDWPGEEATADDTDASADTTDANDTTTDSAEDSSTDAN